MNYKEVLTITCDKGCMYREGEECTLDLEGFKKNEADHVTCYMRCTGHRGSYNYGAVERQLWKEQTTPCEPKEPEQMALVLDGDQTPITENSKLITEDREVIVKKTAAVGKSEEPLTGEIIPPYASYAEYKQELDREVRQEVEGYVHIGYLLKIARDTNILAESGYANLYDFAQAEYSIDKSRVSRYMAINDRFAKDGYSMELKDDYKGYGVAKLSMMLTLPDEINEELSPEMTKSEIQDIRDEVAEEQKITPMEHMLEGETETTEQGETLLEKTVLQLGESESELYRKMHEALKRDADVEEIKRILAPAGEKIYSIRIRGIGRIMMVLRDDKDEITLVNERTGEKETETWESLTQAWKDSMWLDMTSERSWEIVYEQSYPGKAEVAPVQPERKVVKVNPEKPKKPNKEETAWGVNKTEESPVERNDRNLEQKPVQQSAKETIEDWERRMSEPKQETLHEIDKEIPKPEPVEGPEQEPECVEQETVSENAEEQQLPGQTDISDYPEYMPGAEKISQKEFDRKEGEYKEALASNIADAEITAWDKDWAKARENLQNALSIIDKLEALYKLEIKDEEE